MFAPFLFADPANVQIDSGGRCRDDEFGQLDELQFLQIVAKRAAAKLAPVFRVTLHANFIAHPFAPIPLSPGRKLSARAILCKSKF